MREGNIAGGYKFFWGEVMSAPKLPANKACNAPAQVSYLQVRCAFHRALTRYAEISLLISR